MKYESRIFKIFLSVILLISYQQEVMSQEDWKKPGWFFGVGVAPSISKVKNMSVQNGSNLNYTDKIALSGSLEIGYFFSRYFGFSTGLNYSSYNTQLNLDSYQDNLDETDQDNEKYELRVSGSEVAEIQNINVMGIPFYMNIRIPFKTNFGFFAQAGINVAIPLKNSYITSGTFTYEGYFPEYNVLLKDLPEYGFSTGVKTETSGDLQIKPRINFVVASVGFDYMIHNRMQLSVAALFNKSLESISEYIPSENFQLSTGQNQLNSMMEGSSNVILQSFGLNIGLRYFLRDPTKRNIKQIKKRNLKEDTRGEKIIIEK
jgi:hypothetical protein